MKKAKAFMILAVILLYLLPLATAVRFLSHHGSLQSLTGQAVARSLGADGGSQIRRDDGNDGGGDRG
ncbi:hypothetical protein SAY87_000408 [Trapa incisa]|uniref:Uncharacterized protein n=1 Tax=Trapa incisa TaxID=236973 RepID=A0AAN7GTC5_9MYRT|nr:hypothetical protein SAY87_000408 [Trapa incisa]